MEPCCLVFVAARDVQEARRLQQVLVKERLAACAKRIDRVASVFSWKGEVEEETEALLILETRTSLLEKLIARIGQLHSYETPAIAAVPLLGGDEAFLKWIGKATQEE